MNTLLYQAHDDRGQVLIAAAVALFALFTLGGWLAGDQKDVAQSHAETRAKVKKAIQTPARADRVVAQIDDLERETKTLSQAMNGQLESLMTLVAKPESTRQEFDQTFDQLDLLWRQRQRKTLEGRFTIKEMLSREEWTAVFQP
ncbi:MAG TPA: hypothetical protein VFR79_11675 [Nitrospira sp.]|nr:hypothetical protein [Nitrospira sp.]